MPPFSQNHSYQEKAYSESSSSDLSSRGRWDPHFQQYGQKTQTPNPVPLILKHLPQKDARMLFLAHAKLIHSSSQTAKEYANAFHTLFPLEKIDSHQILQGLTARTHTFLQNAAVTL